MSQHILISADFPDVTTDERDKIYDCLKKKKWNKIHNVGRDISTTWSASFEDTVTYKGMKDEIIKDADDCYKEVTNKISKAKLVFQIANNRYETHNC